ncbi:MAG: rhodanese-related sulfurtransferase [Rhodocyclaceae bacterium]|nr:rhodanese-related sulfurtransferase [Rhodocyclaceae bacterium]
MPGPFRRRRHADVRDALLGGREIALLDVREEAAHAQAHPLFAASLPLSRIELDAYEKLPRRDAPIVVLDAGEGLAERAAERLLALGYGDVAVLEGGVDGWRADGGELFRDVNAPSKAFGELVESVKHTPSLAAEEVDRLRREGADLLIVDARRFDEYRTMNIPGSVSVPGAELALRVPALASSPATRVVVNCAGRTRSIIGAQSLINAGIANPVAALRNGTIGWTLAGLALEHGQTRRHGDVPEAVRVPAAAAARALADRAGVRRAGREAVEIWRRQAGRTSYFFDVRDPGEYAAGHLPGFAPAAGGQLVQETEAFAPVRGARIVLADSDGVRAEMTASWLAQMGWETHVLDGVDAAEFSERGAPPRSLPPFPEASPVAPATLAQWLAAGDTAVLDFSHSTVYRRGHVPGAWFVLRSQLAEALPRIPPVRRYVAVSDEAGALARFALPELRPQLPGELFWLAGGTEAWIAAGLPVGHGAERLASPPVDRYRRPYEGTDNPREAMQGYLDWEFGLVAQLARDGTHGFRVL